MRQKIFQNPKRAINIKKVLFEKTKKLLRAFLSIEGIYAFSSRTGSESDKEGAEGKGLFRSETVKVFFKSFSSFLVFSAKDSSGVCL